jgi:spermidine/putrescine transport system permease protein
MTKAAEIARQAEARDIRGRWLLSLPALAIIALASIGPLAIVFVYSFLTPGDYGDVIWKFSPDAWVSVVLKRDIFDNTLSLADAHLSIFWRSVRLALLTTLITLIVGFPTAYFIATRSERTRDLWLLLITIPFWTNLLIRTFAIQQLIRNEGIINSLLINSGVTNEPVQMMFTDFAILLGMAYVYFPLMVLPLYASMEKIDFRLVEAGYDLYANRWQVLRRVIVPTTKPGIIAGSILVFIPTLGAYVTPRVLGGGRNLMLGNLIDLQFGQGRNWPLGASLSTTLMAIVLLALMVYIRFAGRNEGSRYD